MLTDLNMTTNLLTYPKPKTLFIIKLRKSPDKIEQVVESTGNSNTHSSIKTNLIGEAYKCGTKSSN